MQNVSDNNIFDTNYEIKNIIIKPNSVDEHSIYIEVEIEIIRKSAFKMFIAILQRMYEFFFILNLGLYNQV